MSKPDYVNRATQRTMRILEVLAAARQPVALADLARSIAVSKSSVHTIVHTLIADGYLERVGDRIQLTDKTAVFAQPDMDRASLLEAFYALVRTNPQATSETLHLCVPSGRTAVVIAEHPSTGRLVHLSVPVGTSLPLHASASGKVLMSTWSTDAVHITLGSQVLPTFTSRTISSLAALLDELDAIRERGLAESWGEMDTGIVSAAVAVGPGKNLPKAALAMVVPIHRAEPAHWSDAKDRLQFLGRQLERGLA